MKILLINNYHYIKGGSEKYYFDLAHLLKKKDNIVLFLSVKDKESFHSEYYNYFVEPISFDDKQPFLVKFKTAVSMLYSFKNRLKMKIFLSNFKVDIAHAHNIYHRLSPSILGVIKKNKIPTVMTLHDYKLCCPAYLLYREGKICNECLTHSKFRALVNKCSKGKFVESLFWWLEGSFHSFTRIYEKNISYFISPSMFSLKKHLEAGIPEEKLVHVPNFINVSNYSPEYKVGDYVLYVGRLSKEKGLLTLLKAIKGLDVKLKIVGDGPIRSDCERFIKENEINNVEFLGYKSGKDLEALFKRSAFLVIPSEWYENAPMTIIEAFSYGKPVVGSCIGGIPEMVIENETGLLFEMGNWHELREKIKYLLNNPMLIENMGRNARIKAEKDYSEEVHYNRLMDVYKKALSK